jgi:hypothetical protein
MTEKIMTVLSLFPAIIAAVRAVELAIPGSGNGKAKLDIILNSVLAIGEAAKSMVPVITSVVGIVVSGLNAAGVFKKGDSK